MYLFRSFASLHCTTLRFMVKFNTNHQAVQSVQIIFGDLMTIDKKSQKSQNYIIGSITSFILGSTQKPIYHQN